MAIVELLKSLDNLARAIVEKNKEVDEMKKEYESKLRTVNQYLKLLQDPTNHSTTNEETFLTALANQATCPHCEKHLNTSASSEFVLIPRNQIAIKSTPVGDEEEAQETTINDTTEECTSKESEIRHGQAKKQNNSKRICSYCKAPGHSRAKCFKRLSTPQA